MAVLKSFLWALHHHRGGWRSVPARSICQSADDQHARGDWPTPPGSPIGHSLCVASWGIGGPRLFLLIRHDVPKKGRETRDGRCLALLVDTEMLRHGRQAKRTGGLRLGQGQSRWAPVGRRRLSSTI